MGFCKALNVFLRSGRHGSAAILNKNNNKKKKVKSRAHSTTSGNLFLGVLLGIFMAFPSEHFLSPHFVIKVLKCCLFIGRPLVCYL